ncbi:MAG: protein kinase [Clostridiales bacterium]|nr:protein kinase [Clostridiales bacterium]
MAFEKGRTAFEREAQLLNASQDLSGIVPVYRCLNENNTSYLVMEYLEGISLWDSADWYQEPLDSCEDIMRKLMDLVEQIHARGITHHNLAPDNIYLESDGNLRLLDFGNAKREVYQLSPTPLPIYEEGFIAPEILERHKAGTGADLYSLGALYYYLETGKEPPASVKRRKKKRFSVGDPQKDRMIQFLMEPDPGMRPESIAQFRKVYPYL